MRKKLLAGFMALALCSTNMLPQAIFAGEFTSGNLEEVTEETPEIFTDEEQDTAKEASEDISVFSPENVPAFSDETENVLASAQSEGNGEIDLSNNSKVNNGRYTIDHAGTYNFTSNNQVTENQIVIQNIDSNQDKVEIHLNNLKINASNGPALHIMNSVAVEVLIYLQGNNELITTNKSSAGLQKNNISLLTIKNESDNVIGYLDASNKAMDQSMPQLPIPASNGAGIGSGMNESAVSNICISGVSVTASSTYGAGIGSGLALNGGISGNCSDITISNSTVTATSTYGAGIGSGHTLGGAGCTNTSGTCSDIFISGGSVKGSSIGCIPRQSQNGSQLYLCEIPSTSSSPVTIDDKPWTPSSHLSDDYLYAWLTGEDHFVTVGSKNRCYIFTSGTFTQKGKHTITINDFNFNPPTDLTYDGNSKPVTVIPKVSFKDMAENITVKYFPEDKLINGFPVNAGDYTVKIAVSEGEFYNSANDLTDSNWSFTIKKSDNTPNFPSKNAIPVPWSCKKVNEIDPDPLPENWEWYGSDKIKDLNVGDNTATAFYTGKDANKGNYNTETVTYIITREACKHPHTTERYYSSPSCTSSGYSGDTYCTDCGVLVSSGYTISAYGHDYDNGVITTEPTTETDGIITYTCKRCQHQDTKNLGKLGDGEPYIEGSFQKKGWDAVNDLIKASKEKDTISITLNGAKVLPATVLSEIKGKDISLNLDMENGFIWKINGTSITAETPADTDLSVTNTEEYKKVLNNMFLEAMKNLEDKKDLTIYIVKNDKDKIDFSAYGKLEILEDSYIGGVKLQSKNILVDNTILTNLKEKIYGTKKSN